MTIPMHMDGQGVALNLRAVLGIYLGEYFLTLIKIT